MGCSWLKIALFRPLGAFFSVTRGYVKSILPPSAAEFHIETALGSLILLRKINEPSAVSNYYLARSAVKNLFTQPLSKQYSAATGGKSLLVALRAELYFFKSANNLFLLITGQSVISFSGKYSRFNALPQIPCSGRR